MNRAFAIRQHPFSTAELVLWLWLALGLAVLTAAPALLAVDPTLGWLPFWLVVAPAFDLALLHRERLMAAARGFLVGARRHHRPARQARRLRHRRRARAAVAAMLSRRARVRAAHP